MRGALRAGGLAAILRRALAWEAWWKAALQSYPTNVRVKLPGLLVSNECGWEHCCSETNA